MTRLRRPAAVTLFLLGALLLAPAPLAVADCHTPISDGWPCPQPPPPPPTPTPDPTPAPTPAPETPAPTEAPPPSTPAPTQPPAAPARAATTPAPTVFDDIEVPTPDPLATPEIIVDGPIDDEMSLDVVEPSASASSWIFGFVVGLLIGGFIGRASWGLRNRRRGKIFG